MSFNPVPDAGGFRRFNFCLSHTMKIIEAAAAKENMLHFSGILQQELCKEGHIRPKGK